MAVHPPGGLLPARTHRRRVQVPRDVEDEGRALHEFLHAGGTVHVVPFGLSTRSGRARTGAFAAPPTLRYTPTAPSLTPLSLPRTPLLDILGHASTHQRGRPSFHDRGFTDADLFDRCLDEPFPRAPLNDLYTRLRAVLGMVEEVRRAPFPFSQPPSSPSFFPSLVEAPHRPCRGHSHGRVSAIVHPPLIPPPSHTPHLPLPSEKVRAKPRDQVRAAPI